MYKKGLLLNLIKNPIATAVSFAANDLIKEYMHACSRTGGGRSKTGGESDGARRPCTALGKLSVLRGPSEWAVGGEDRVYCELRVLAVAGRSVVRLYR